jgi:hypothetical protein
MSRWKEAFENGDFKTTWDKLSDEILSLKEEDFELDIDHIAELARLKRVVSYLKGIINNLDIELVPALIFSQLTTHCPTASVALSSYISTKNLAELKKVNVFIDHILLTLKPYDSNEKGLSDEASQSLMAYKQSFESSVTEFINDLEIKKNEINLFHKNINDLHHLYFEDSDAQNSLKQQVEELLRNADGDFEKIHAFYSDLFEGGVNSIATKVEQAKIDVDKDAEAIRKAYAGASNNLEDIDSYYIQVMGEEDPKGVRSGGLKSELDKLLKNLYDFEKEQKTKYTALNEEIKSALPSATRVGLATAFSDMKKSFSVPIIINSLIFYAAVISLVGISLYFLIDIDEKGKIIVLTFTNLSDALSNLAQKLPIILPLVWLAVFASKRRSESQRLQQEYAHKEALAFSYQNFKEQIDKLGAENKEEMLDKLLVSAIYAVASNASETLDKKHGDNSPVHDLFNGLVKSVWSKKTDKSE